MRLAFNWWTQSKAENRCESLLGLWMDLVQSVEDLHRRKTDRLPPPTPVPSKRDAARKWPLNLNSSIGSSLGLQPASLPCRF